MNHVLAARFSALLALVILVPGCHREEFIEESDVPYPPDEEMIYYQAQCDSGYQEFWKDIKATTSAYLNNSRYAEQSVGTDHMQILGEGLFHGVVEVELPEILLQVTLERKFKSKGRIAVWQIIAVEEKPWPKEISRSAR